MYVCDMPLDSFRENTIIVGSKVTETAISVYSETCRPKRRG